MRIRGKNLWPWPSPPSLFSCDRSVQQYIWQSCRKARQTMKARADHDKATEQHAPRSLGIRRKRHAMHGLCAAAVVGWIAWEAPLGRAAETTVVTNVAPDLTKLSLEELLDTQV